MTNEKNFSNFGSINLSELLDVLNKLPIDKNNCEVRIDNYADYRMRAFCISKDLSSKSITLTDDIEQFLYAHDFDSVDLIDKFYDYYDMHGNKLSAQYLADCYL